METTADMLPTQRLCLPIEEFTNGHEETLIELLSTPEAAKYIGSLKISAALLLENDQLEQLAPFFRPAGHLVELGARQFPVIADLSLSGGYDVMVKHVENAITKFGLRRVTFTFAQGVTRDAIEYVTGNVTQREDLDVTYLTTGWLPENDMRLFEEAHGRTVRRFTQDQVTLARRTKVAGAYASANIATAKRRRLQVGAGISFDGKPYVSRGIRKPSEKIERALVNCQQIVTGNGVLFVSGVSVLDAFYAACSRVDLAVLNENQPLT